MEYTTICVPTFFPKLPLDIQILVFEFNWEHRIMLKKVLDEFMRYLFCDNCGKIMLPSLLNRVSSCSSECMYDFIEDYKESYSYVSS